MSRRFRSLVAVCVAGALSAIAAPIVVAAGGDKDDNVSPASTPVTASSTHTVFKAVIDKIPVTSTCGQSSTRGTTPPKGLGPWVTSDPTFKKCHDNVFKKTDIVKTSGTWTVTFKDASGDEGGEGQDYLILTVPQAGATITPTGDPQCTITVAPSAPAMLKGKYDDAGKLDFKVAPLPFATNSGCPGGVQNGTGTFTATYKLKPPIKDAG